MRKMKGKRIFLVKEKKGGGVVLYFEVDFTCFTWWERLVCRKGMMLVFTPCKVYYPTVDPSRLTLGFPELKADGSKYQPNDYYRVAKDVRHLRHQDRRRAETGLV